MAASSSSSKSNHKQQLMHSVSPACKETLKTPTQLQKFSERAPNSTTRLSFRHPHNQCSGVMQHLDFSAAPRTPQNFGSCSVERFDNVGCRTMTPRNKMVCRSSMSSKVKAMADESIRVSRKAQARRESWLQSQEKLLTAWLNGLLKKPMKQPQPQTQPPRIVTQSCPTPKPPKIRSLRPPPTPEKFLGKPPVLTADSCLKDVCGLADLKQRLALYMDAASVNDLVSSIFKIATCVDDGRLRMKENCAIITDVGLKNKAIKVMMNYNPVWLRLGLHVVLGYSDLAPSEPLKLGLEKPINERTAATDEEFLKLVIEKNFFAHPGLAKTYAFNKGIDGLYRQGYYEALGKVILKRFLLFVMMLDKIKKENAYPIDQGIDGLDGGSPLLFCRNSWVKSSRQALHEFLSDVMYGEGDVVSHLVMLGYQVSHVQSPLSEYDFHVSNLMENMQDGVILCRLACILCQDTSILARIKLPCDYHKKNLHNCNVALEYFLQAGVPLKDEEGMHFTAENVVYGDREKILSFLWSIFIELQMPLLISKEKLKEKIFRIKGCEDTEMEMSLNSHGTMEMMLQWIKGVCAAYGKQVNDLKSLYSNWTYALYLIDFYVPGCVPHYLLKEVDQVSESSMDFDSGASLQKFKRARDIIKGILDIPEITEVIEENTLYKDKNVIMMVTFLSAQLLARNPSEVKEMVNIHTQINEIIRIQSYWRGWLARKQKKENALLAIQNKAATKIQCCWRKGEHHSKYHKVRNATILIQSYCRGWLVKEQLRTNALLAIQNRAATKIQSCWRKGEHHSNYHKVRNATILIQSYCQRWLARKQKRANTLLAIQNRAATKIQSCWRKRKHQSKFSKVRKATILIQSYYKGWLARKQKRANALLAIQNRAATKIQSCWRKQKRQSKYTKGRKATILIQCYYRGWLAKKQKRANAFLAIQNREALKIQSCWRKREHQSKFLKFKNATVLIQSYCRGWLAMKQKKANDLLAIQNKAATKIQCYWKKRGHQSKYLQLKNATILIQSYCRGWLARKKFLSYLSSAVMIQSSFRMYRHRKLFMLYKEVAIIMQSIIRRILALQQSRVLHCTNPVNHTFAAVTIQAHIRGWLRRKAFSKANKSAICIQAHWRGYKVRCNSQPQISALRAQIKTSASNVDKSHCLENRLTAALEALLHRKSLSSILHICNTLDLATQQSRRCCEKLVEVGAIDKILQVIRSANRSTPFEEVLKHAFSVLSNIAGHQDLAPFIINTPESVNTVAEQLMRKNNQVFCRAAQVLKKLCAVQGGAEALRKLPLFIRRLMQLSQSLEKKLQTQKRNLETLNQKACDPTVKMVENKWKNMLLQHQLITELLQLIQLKPIPSPCAKARRYSEVPKVLSSVPPKMRQRRPSELMKGNNRRYPFQDCSNQ